VERRKAMKEDFKMATFKPKDDAKMTICAKSDLSKSLFKVCKPTSVQTLNSKVSATKDSGKIGQKSKN
jgi:hypothetical protein